MKVKLRLPKQHTRIGTAGYLGGDRVETYDPRAAQLPVTVVSGAAPDETDKAKAKPGTKPAAKPE